MGPRRQQDEELDQLGRHVERLGGLGREIHGELESQSRMLDDLVSNLGLHQHAAPMSQLPADCCLGQPCMHIAIAGSATLPLEARALPACRQPAECVRVSAAATACNLMGMTRPDLAAELRTSDTAQAFAAGRVLLV